MATLTFTQADLDALKAAYLTGALTVEMGDRKITYRSQKDLLSAIKAVQEAINGVSDDVDDNPNVVQAGYARAPRCSE